MEDSRIIELYWERDQQAIQETAGKYGRLLERIAGNILGRQDAEECVNDTWLNAWNAMPENRPSLLGPFLGKITRNLAFTCWRTGHTEKRGGGELPLVLDELSECVSSADVLQEIEAAELVEIINRFLHALPERECSIFLRRCWFAEPTADIAKRYSMRESTVRTSLFRSREKLKRYLKKEGLL